MATEGFTVYKALQTALIGFALALSFSPVTAMAAPMAAQSEPSAAPIAVQVVAVRATREGKADPNLRGLEKEMASRGYHGFRVTNIQKEAVSSERAGRFELPGSFATQVRMVSATSTHATLQIRVLKDGEFHHKLDVTLPRNQGYIHVVKPEDSSAAVVMIITPKF